MSKNLIPYQNSKKGKIFKIKFEELSKIVKKNKDYKFNYKNFELHIRLTGGYYCGYITKFDPSIKKKFKKNEINNLEEIKGIYKIHGDYTHPRGFDCGHLKYDIYVGITKNYTGKTFKTHLFVESELKKTVNSIIKIAKQR
jgi:hypothetical protein